MNEIDRSATVREIARSVVGEGMDTRRAINKVRDDIFWIQFGLVISLMLNVIILVVNATH